MGRIDRHILKAHVLDAVVRPETTLVGAQLRNQSCDRIDAPGFGELDNFPEGGLGTLVAANRLHSAVCQGGDLPQAQQSTVGGHERQAKHFCCSGQKAIRWIRMLKRQFLGYCPGFGKARANRLSWGKMAAAG